MLTKHLLKISLLLPLVAMSATAQAGSTITGKSYWPNEARPAVTGVAASHNSPSSAFASSASMPRFEVVPIADDSGNVRRYHGGPKYP
jgi:hypothetical protein